MLIAVILSAQATDISVNIATKRLFPVANTPQDILALGQGNLEQYIRTIGLFRTKAKNIIKCCEQLIHHHQGQVPNSRPELEALAGVGRKTANVILNTAFNQPTIAVDTHVFRVGRRLGLASGKTVNKVEDELLQNIPDYFLDNAHHWLILFGRYICTARNPQCNKCYLYALCNSADKN